MQQYNYFFKRKGFVYPISNTNKVSLRKYLYAYDLFEVLASNLLIKLKKPIGINIFQNSLEEIENDRENIYSARIGDLNGSWMHETLIYHYYVINDRLNNKDCAYLNKFVMHETETNKLNPFYSYFDQLTENVQLKLEHYFINPFLTEKMNERFRNEMFRNYLQINGDSVKYNKYLPQRRVQLTKHVRGGHSGYPDSSIHGFHTGYHNDQDDHSEGQNYGKGHGSGYGGFQGYY
uniref:Uncharacterized protein n=1 Tax=Meloidogyne javanica TaxID=6303 RepID=A0A915MZ39_MELJA